MYIIFRNAAYRYVLTSVFQSCSSKIKTICGMQCKAFPKAVISFKIDSKCTVAVKIEL